MCPSDRDYAGCAIECSSFAAAWTNEERAAHWIAALQNVRCCLEASCHLPTEILGWFNLVLAQCLSSANLNSHSSIAFYPHLLKGLNLAGTDAWPLVGKRAELRYWFWNVRGSNSSGNIEQYLSSIRCTQLLLLWLVHPSLTNQRTCF